MHTLPAINHSFMVYITEDSIVDNYRASHVKEIFSS